MTYSAMDSHVKALIDPDEGGSANNYDYSWQDPVNTYDLDGMEAVAIPTWTLTVMANPIGMGLLGMYLLGSAPTHPQGYMQAKGRRRIRDTGLQNVPDAEIQRLARDPNIPKAERERYKREEKARGLRRKRRE